MQEVEIEYAEPFYPLFDYLKPENKKLIPLPEMQRYVDLDRSLYRFIGFHGGRGSGKSHHFALALLIIARMEKVLVLCCREVQATIKDSVHRILKTLIEDHGLTDYSVQNESIRNNVTGSEFIFKGFYQHSQEIKSLFNVDICWVEEAQSLSEMSIKVLKPTIRKPRSQLWFSFNRFKPNDPVWELIFKNPSKRTYVRHINYDENPFFERTELHQDFTEDLEKVKEGSMSQDDFDWVWFGEPMGQDERALFKRKIITESINRPFSTKGNVLIPIGSGKKLCGIDPSGLGKDRMIWEMFEEYPIIDNRKEKPETIYLYREVKNKEMPKTTHAQRIGTTIDFVDKDMSIPIKIDATNMQGFGEDLGPVSEGGLGYNVYQVHFAGKAKDETQYSSARDEMAFELEDRTRKGRVSYLPCPQREKEMQAYLWGWKKAGKYMHKSLEPKSVFKTREGYSPDYFDATCLALYKPREGPKVGIIII